MVASSGSAEGDHKLSLEPPLRPPFSEDVSLPLHDEQHHATDGPSLPQSNGIGTAADPRQPPPVPPQILEALPTITRDPQRNHEVRLISDDRDAILAFLARDLDVSRLRRISHWLWMAGRPMNARPLHRQRMLDLRILPTEQADLHLLHADGRIFIKPLPAYLLDHAFWTTYLCHDRALHAQAAGLLLSYIWLLLSPLDLQLAHEHGLLPSTLGGGTPIRWRWWKTFVRSVGAHLDLTALDQVDARYHFGELRLGRVNALYRLRFWRTHFVRGYLYTYNRYAVFFARNFAWVLVVFVYFSLVLAAMQVGTAVEPLAGSAAFRRACYGFVVFSIVLVAVTLALVAVLFLAIFFVNMYLALTQDKAVRMGRSKLAEERKGRTA